jgi:ribose-phosphate pyrophosphokinase
VLSGDALKKIDQSPLNRLVISDTIQPLPGVLNAPKIEILTAASLLGEAIHRIAHDQSISSVLR